jgi:hypothetical protein
MCRKIAFRGQLLAGLPSPGIQRITQVDIDLVVQRDRAELETETGQPKRSSCGSMAGVWSCASVEY